MANQILSLLEQKAAALPEVPFPISLDWFNGRRSPNSDDTQTGGMQGLTLGTTAPHIYRSLVFAAVCGLKRIVAGFVSAGVEIDEVIAVGGISKKSNFVMQMMADVLNKTIAIVDSDQTCALGAALYASVACGIYANIETASPPHGREEDQAVSSRCSKGCFL